MGAVLRPHETRGHRLREVAFASAVLLLLILACARPGDAPFINDEPRIIERALSANAEGRLETVGLVGHLGVPYGPLPVQIYQVALLLTRNLVAIVALKSLLTAAVIVLCLLWIARVADLSRIPILAALVSPYLYFYGRILWDNCFLIPLSAAIIAAYTAFSHQPTLRKLVLVLLLGVSMVATHLMSALLLLPLAPVMLAVQWRWFVRSWWKVLLALAATALILLPYLEPLLADPIPVPGSPIDPELRMASSLTPARLSTFTGFAEHFLPQFSTRHPWLPARAIDLLITASTIGLLIMAGGLIWLLFDLGRKLLQRRPLTAQDSLGLLCLATLATTLLFYRLVNLPAVFKSPHYANAVWLPPFFLLWKLLSDAWSHRWARVVFWSHFVVTGGLLLLLVDFIHDNGGNRDIHYGQLLSNQIEVARELNQYAPDSHIVCRSHNQLRFPHAIAVLRRLVAVDTDGQRGHGLLVVEYRMPFDQQTGFIEVRAAGRLYEGP